MRKSIKYKGKNNDTIVYSKGMTDKDIIDVLTKRIQKRQIELDKRRWIYDEYCRLMDKQHIDISWLDSFKKGLISVKK